MSNDDIRIEYLGNTPSPDAPIISLITVSTILNLLFYKILPSSLNPLIKTYIISTIHAFLAVFSVLIYFLKYEINFKQINRIVGGGLFGTGDEMMVYSVCYSSGYFLYDLILMLKIKLLRNDPAIFHHLIILLTFAIGLFMNVCHPCHFYFLAEELSTIPLNFKALARDRPRLHQIFSFLFVLTFFLSRIIYGSIIAGYAFRAAPQFLQMAWNTNDKSTFYVGLFQAVLCVLTRLLNFYWAVLILQKVFHSKSSNKSD